MLLSHQYTGAVTVCVGGDVSFAGAADRDLGCSTAARVGPCTMDHACIEHTWTSESRIPCANCLDSMACYRWQTLGLKTVTVTAHDVEQNALWTPRT